MSLNKISKKEDGLQANYKNLTSKKPLLKKPDEKGMFQMGSSDIPNPPSDFFANEDFVRISPGARPQPQPCGWMRQRVRRRPCTCEKVGR